MGFYVTYAICVAAAAGLVLIPRALLQLIILCVQVRAGIVLPSAIIFLQLLLNDKELMGEQYVNKPWNNWVNFPTATHVSNCPRVLPISSWIGVCR